LVILSARADVLYQDSFNYFDGPIIVNGTNADGSTNWFHTGNATASDFLVKNHKAEISATGSTNGSRAEDVHCNFSSFTNTQTILYSSFTVNCTNLPPAIGTYFAHFFVSSTTFHGRVYAQAGSLPGTWRLGIAGAATTVSQVLPVDLAPNTDYQVVVQWDPVTSFAGTIWVNPISTSDLNVTSSDAITTPAASLGYGFRQGGSFGSAFFDITNLVVATTFDEAVTNVWSTNAVPPLIVQSPTSGTNFVGDPVTLIGLAAGQGLANITYQWQKDGVDVT